VGLEDTFGIRWTDSQRDALDIHVNTAVTAGAGSGKTQVLAARYLLAAQQLIASTEYKGPEHILVLTFTDKAAAEMRERIGAAIQNYVRGSDFSRLDPLLKDRWLRFYTDLPVGEISTIHSFCARILRQYPVEARVDPEFAIIETYQQKQLLEDSIRAVVSRLARGMDESLALLLKTWSAPRLAEVLAMLAENGPLLSDWFDRYGNRTIVELERDQRETIMKAVERGLKELNTADHAQLIAEIDACPTLKDAAGDRLEEQRRVVAGCWRRCMQSIGTGDVDIDALTGLIDALCRQDGSPRSFRNMGSASVWGKQGKEFVGGRLQLLAEAVSAHVSDLSLRFGERDLASVHVLKALAIVARSVFEHFRQSKDRSGVLDFSDLETRARELLTMPSVRASLASRYRYVLVDEFQDTNGMQWEIIRSLCTTEDGSFSPDKLFLVGDEKQAIYSFRGGDVTTFARARRELAAGTTAPGAAAHGSPGTVATHVPGADISAAREASSYRKVVFEDNFRSCQRLVDSFNYLFSRLLSSGEVPDYEAQFQHMVKSNEKITQDGWAEIHLLRTSDGIDRLAAEAEMVAELAKRMASDDAVKALAGGEMPLVAILLRRMSAVKIYESALRRHGLAFSTVKGRGFYAQQEVLDLFNLLAFLSDPRRDIELFGVLRSPVFGLSDDDVVAILGTGTGSVWDRLRSSQIPKAVRCTQMLESWREIRDRCSVARLIRHILVDSGLYAPLAYGRRGKQRLANVEKVISLARSSDARGSGLAEFVEFLERQMESEEPEGEAELTIESPVVLMTIHQAKGLQFPAVIVPDLSARFNMGFEAPVYIGEVEGRRELGIKAPDPLNQGAMEKTALRTLIQSTIKKRDLAEQKRLLYVAATRARLLLALVGQAPSRSVQDKSFEELLCWSEWVWKACDLESVDEDTLAWSAHLQQPIESARVSIGPMTAILHRLAFAQPPAALSAAGRVAAAEASAGLDEMLDGGTGEAAGAVAGRALDDMTESEDGGLRSVSKRLDILDKLAKAELAPVTEQRRVLSRRVIDLSATAVMDYTRCPRLYYLRHYIGVPEQLLDQWADSACCEASAGCEPSGGCRAEANPRRGYSEDMASRARSRYGEDMTMGARIGDLLHRLIAHEVYGPGDPRTEMLVKSLLPPAELPLLGTYVETINAHLSSLQSLGYADRLRSLPRNARRCEVELDLVVGSTDQYVVRFTGFIDMLVSTQAGKWRILDFKTNAVGGADIARFTKEHLYDLQMELYMAAAGLALSRAGREDTIEKAEIIYTSAALRHEVDPDPNAIDKLLEVARSIYDGRFPRCDGACDTCGYEAVCRP